jgi:uncharacterized protein (TIGR02001 family)
MNKNIIAIAATSLLAVSVSSHAALSSTVNLASDYTFNGVSQTINDPALQASFDFAADNGFYAGTWASNVDFGAGEDTNIEWDAYIGKFYQLNDKVGLDTGIAYYTYHGDDASDTYNYPEVYAKFAYNSSMGDTEFNFWYSWDYFGLDVNHYIAMIAHTVEVGDGHSIKVSFDRSTSADENKWAWDGDDAYNHYRVEYMTSWQGFDFDLAAENTSMNMDTADSRIVLAVSRTFSF